MRRLCRVLAALALLALGVAAALAAPGDLDPGFGDNGSRQINLAGDDVAFDVALRPDGRMVIVGKGFPTADVVVLGLLANGKDDPDLDGDGARAIDLGATEIANAVALQPDGKILVAGTTITGGAGGDDLAVLRLRPDGSDDPDFSGTGRRIIDYGGAVDRAYDVALRPDGRIVVVGSGRTTADAIVQGLLSNGDDDPSLGPGGLAAVDLGASEVAAAVALQPDGKIVLAGWTTAGSAGFLARLTAGGAPDATFNGTGTRPIDFGGQEFIEDVVVQPDGRIVVLGNDEDDLAVQRFLPGGASDPGFNGGQPLTVSLVDAGSERGSALALQPDGRIVLAGTSYAALAKWDVAVARLRRDGTLDPTFGAGGKRSVDLGPYDEALEAAQQPDGKLVIVGDQSTGSNDEIQVLRLEGGGAEPGAAPPAPAGAGAGAGAVPRCGGKAATIVGTAGRDRLRGTRRADVIAALRGDDVVRGLGGADLVCGGAGRDLLVGGPGADRLLGGAGRDRLRGGAGRDRLLGGPGRDDCVGGAGADRGACERRLL